MRINNKGEREKMQSYEERLNFRGMQLAILILTFLVN